MNTKKIKEFPPVEKQTWMDQAVKDLKGGDFEQALNTKVLEGFTLSPFYTAEDTKTCQWVKFYENAENRE